MSQSAMGQPVHVRVPGKINLFLRAGAPGADGYHPLATVFQAVSLYEDLWAAPAPDFSISIAGPTDGSIDVSKLSVDDSNLAIRAAKLLAERTGIRSGVELKLVKSVPIAGGMGGGSADAAAVLVACNRLWSTGLEFGELLELARLIGADVPFALVGGTAIGVNRGDELSPVLTGSDFNWVLAFVSPGLSTPTVFAELDRLRANMREVSGVDFASRAVLNGNFEEGALEVDPALLHALRSGDAKDLAGALHNDLQTAAISLRPELRRIIDLGIEGGALAGIVSGSGPTLAFLCDGPEAARLVQAAFARGQITSVLVTAPVAGALQVE